MSTSRLESFSDGVIAVAVTLLVLNIRVPIAGAHPSLASRLLGQWPTYAAYVTSFVTIGIIWINHHAMIGRLRDADYSILLLNLLLLMSIVVLPFATSLIATYLKRAHGQHLAAGLYSGSFLVMGIFFLTLNHHILMRKPHFLSSALEQPFRRQILRRNSVGLLVYAVATALAAVSAYATLAICALIAVYYALPVTRGSSGG